MVEDQKFVTVSLIERPDYGVLAVWDLNYSGWVLPGGKVKPGESLAAAQTRELYEETGLLTVSREIIWSGPSAKAIGYTVFIYKVEAIGNAIEMELGRHVAWTSREALLCESPYKKTYEQVFAITQTQGAIR